MNVLDENIDDPQRQQLEAWKIHVRQIGVELGRLGMDDREQIIPLLHTLRRPTLFTRDRDFYDPWLRHPGYCLVFLEVKPDETAQFVRRFFATQCSAHKRSAWAKLCAFTRTGSDSGKSTWASRKR
jgi:hypothetical protein